MKEPKVKMKDRAKFPKVQDQYEKEFKKSYQQMMSSVIKEFTVKLGAIINKKK